MKAIIQKIFKKKIINSFYKAIKIGSIEQVKSIYEKHGNLLNSETNRDNNVDVSFTVGHLNPLEYAFCYGQNFEVWQFLKDKQFKIRFNSLSYEKKEVFNLLANAITYGNENILSDCLENCNLLSSQLASSTKYLLFVGEKQANNKFYIIAKYSNVFSHDCQILFDFISIGYSFGIEKLIEAGINLNAQNHRIIYELKQRFLPLNTFFIMMNNGLQINQTDLDDLLNIAYKQGYIDYIKSLVSLGANELNIPQPTGKIKEAIELGLMERVEKQAEYLKKHIKNSSNGTKITI